MKQKCFSFLFFCFLFCIPKTLTASPSNNFYVLTWPTYNPGFFSVFNTVIGFLDFYEKHHPIGIQVDFGTRGWYYDRAMGPNSWEYFFEPISFGKPTTAKVVKVPNYKKVIYSLTAQFQMPRERAHFLIKKYIRLKPHMEKKVEDFVQNNFKGFFVIGVHYRGTDKVTEAPYVSYEMVTEHVNKAIAQLSDAPYKIFIATDDSNFLHFMKDQYPDLILNIDAIRSSDEKPVHVTSSENYKKGEEAILDCIFLSRTNLLLKTASNLSDCSIQFNPTIRVIHLNKSYSEI